MWPRSTAGTSTCAAASSGPVWPGESGRYSDSRPNSVAGWDSASGPRAGSATIAARTARGLLPGPDTAAIAFPAVSASHHVLTCPIVRSSITAFLLVKERAGDAGSGRRVLLRFRWWRDAGVRTRRAARPLGQADRSARPGGTEPGRGAGVNSVSCPQAGSCAGGGAYTDRHQNSHGFVVSQTG